MCDIVVSVWWVCCGLSGSIVWDRFLSNVSFVWGTINHQWSPNVFFVQITGHCQLLPCASAVDKGYCHPHVTIE
jgi:hypothetical protein